MSTSEEASLASGEDGPEKTGAMKKDSRWAIFGRVLRGGATKMNSNNPQQQSPALSEEEEDKDKIDLTTKKSTRLTLPRQLKKLEESLFSRESSAEKSNHQTPQKPREKESDSSRPTTTGRFSRLFRLGRKDTKTSDPLKERSAVSRASSEDTSLIPRVAREATVQLLTEECDTSEIAAENTRQIVTTDNS